MSTNPNKTDIDGEGNLIFQDIKESEIKVFVKKDSSNKKSFPVQKFLPKNFPQSLIYFTGRENVLKNIAEALETHGSGALADTHGAGKSSVVIEFAHRQKASYKHILFIRATNNEFNGFVSEIVEELGFDLPADALPEQRLAVLQEWLAKNEDWLLLIDNIDDVEFIKACEFNKSGGKVIYTANDERIFKIAARVDLPKLSDENAILLLYKHWQDNADAKFKDIPENAHPALKGIAHKFGNHPFSMAFVGSYLAEEDENLEEFLEAYQSKEKNLLEKYKFITNYQHKNVATAFVLRFEQISTPKDKTKREKFLTIAVNDYLKLLAFIGTDNIPEELLHQALAKLHPDQAGWTETTEFIKDIYKKFKPTSIFKRNAENKTLTTHRIVQEIMRFQVKDEEEIFLKILAEVLDNNFEWFEFTNKEKVERYLSHVGVFLEYLEESKAKTQENLKLENESTANLCNNYARYFEQYGQYKKAEIYYQLFKDICEAKEGIGQILTATSYNNLAGLYRTQGQYELAEPLYKKVIDIFEKVLGENHPDTATSYNNLAFLYYWQSKYNLAEPLYKKALAIREQVLGENHPSTATSYNNLALLYYSQGKYELSELLYKKVIDIFEKVLGENHPSTATSYNNLAALYESQSKYDLAEPLYKKALAIREEVLRENHPDTASSYNDLAVLYKSQGKYDLAEPLYKKALAIREEVLGENHPDTITSYNNLALLYYSQGKYELAEPLYKKVIDIFEKVLGENHPDTAQGYNNLAALYESQGKGQPPRPFGTPLL